ARQSRDNSSSARNETHNTPSERRDSESGQEKGLDFTSVVKLPLCSARRRDGARGHSVRPRSTGEQAKSRPPVPVLSAVFRRTSLRIDNVRARLERRPIPFRVTRREAKLRRGDGRMPRSPGRARWYEMRRFDIDPNNHTAGPVAGKPDNPTFADLGVHPDIVRALSESGIERTFDIQALTLPLALRGEDVIGQARTGTGKALGFGVPLLQRLVTPGDGTPQALVVVPTRELCLQVSQDLAEAGKYLGVRITSIYGGRPYESQIQSLRSGVDVVIGTPGRLLDLAEQRNLVLGKISTLVLDEA